jgi:UDP-N-acetylmuramoyl-tripeptide--D-alanyl-D-alanine ligase
LNAFAWTARDVAAALGLPHDSGDDRLFPRVSTDTRSLQPGDLFLALRGVRFDAHEMLVEARAAGAAAAVVSRIPEEAPEGMRFFLVDDTLRALGALGHYRRERLNARVIGVVGSNGKTTTKDLLRAALSSRYRLHATQGNLNNQIGVPLTLLAAPDDAEVLVVEMGTNEPGEIEILSAIVRPEVVVVTSIGEEHLEKLGSLEGVLEEELSALTGLESNGMAFVAEEPVQLRQRATTLLGAERVRVAGLGEDADLRPDGGEGAIEVLPDGTTRWSWRGHPLRLPLPGRFNVRNALLALGVATELGVPEEDAVRGVEGVSSAKLRGEWHDIGNLRVLADCYNSNPPSVAAAVELLASLPTDGHKVAVLGTMREMGDSAPAIHERVAAVVASKLGEGIDLIVATGAFVEAFAALPGPGDPRIIRCVDPVEAYEALAGRLDGDETILLKASRGEALERWLPLLTREWEKGGS